MGGLKGLTMRMLVPDNKLTMSSATLAIRSLRYIMYRAQRIAQVRKLVLQPLLQQKDESVVRV